MQLQAGLHILYNLQLCYCNQSTGKLLVGDATTRTISNISATSWVLYLTDNNLGDKFLIDTGAGVSVLPPQAIDLPDRGKSRPLIATNGSQIETCGQRAMKLDFGLGRQDNWVFYVADIMLILGVDFLGESKFIINIHNGSITNKCTNTTIIAASTKLSLNKNTTIIPRSAYLALLDEFPSLL